MALYTQKAIMRTFQQMLEEMPFDKITVSALVRRCEISPNTFYYHYQDIYALLNVWFHSEFDQYMQFSDESFDWVAAAKDMLRDCKAHPKTIYHVFNSLSRDQMEQYVFTSTDDIFYHLVCLRAAGRRVDEADLKRISSFCRYAFIGYLLQFLWNRMEDNIDESVDRLSVLFEDFVDSAVSRCAEQNA